MRRNRLKTLARLSMVCGLALSATLLAGPETAAAGWQVVQQSIGAPNAGRLVNASKLNHSRAVKLRFPKNAWGTRRLVDLTEQCARLVRQRHKRTHRLVIGDLSRRRGGRFAPHAGHQAGREADVGFYMRRGRPLDGLWRVGVKDIDARRTWTFVQCLLQSGEVLQIFLDRDLQPALYFEAKRRGWKKARLLKTFSYPRAKRARQGLIQHRNGHDNHLHVLIRCAKHETRCRNFSVASSRRGKPRTRRKNKR